MVAVLVGAVFVPAKATRATETSVGCQQAFPYEYNPIPNSTFANYESTEYINGYLAIHLKVTQVTGDYGGIRWYPNFILIDDQCHTYSMGHTSDMFGLDPTARNISFRFDSPNHYQLYNDDTNTPLTCKGCSVTLDAFASFFKVRLHNKAYSYDGVTGEITSSAHHIKENPSTPPQLEQFPVPSGCQPMSIQNDMVEPKQSVEYVGGFPWVHFQNNPFRLGLGYDFNLKFKFYDSSCTPTTTIYDRPVFFGEPFVSRFSIRFTSPTHFTLWNDDLDRKIPCPVYCESDITIPASARYLSVSGVGQLPDANGFLQPASFTSIPFPVKEPGIDPVIIIPGILGSWDKNGTMVIDPVLHTYDDLIETLQANGYVLGTDLFTFPYEWRNSNIVSAQGLRDKINDVQAICQCAKVDLVAHSMGGLVARQYIQSSDYENDVDQLIFLGTPHLGGSKAYLSWEGGQFGSTKLDNFMEFLFKQEAKKAGYSSRFDYIQHRVFSTRELLPIFDYLRDKDTGILRSFPVGYPQNTFLANLTAGTSSFLSSGVRISNFVGDLGISSTIDKFRVVTSTKLPLWEDGYPENFGDTDTDQGLELGNGDGTVSLESAKFIDADLTTLVVEHRELVTQAEGMVYKKLTGKDPMIMINKDRGRNYWLIIKMLSPADMLIIAPDGKRIGKDFATGQEINEIPDAFYSGFLTDDEYITIPNPLDGDYKVQTQGTGTGEYTVASGFITASTSAEQDFTGNTIPGATNELNVTIDNSQPEQIVIVPADTTPPSINITSPVATGTYTRSNLFSISATITDPSGVAQTLRFFDGISASPTFDPFFSKLGFHTVRIQATDTVNNTASKSVGFTIIATFDSGITDASRAYTLGWIKTKTVKNSIINKFENARDNARRRASVLGSLSSYLDTQYTKKTINQQAYDILKEDVAWLQTH